MYFTCHWSIFALSWYCRQKPFRRVQWLRHHYLCFRFDFLPMWPFLRMYLFYVAGRCSGPWLFIYLWLRVDWNKYLSPLLFEHITIQSPMLYNENGFVVSNHETRNRLCDICPVVPEDRLSSFSFVYDICRSVYKEIASFIPVRISCSIL